MGKEHPLIVAIMAKQQPVNKSSSWTVVYDLLWRSNGIKLPPCKWFFFEAELTTKYT